MGWDVKLGDEFEPEFEELPEDVRIEILAHARLLQQFGPRLGRPRVAFAFDTRRKAILLVAGDKSGGSQKRFYKQLIARADDRFNAHLARLKKKERK